VSFHLRIAKRSRSATSGRQLAAQARSRHGLVRWPTLASLASSFCR